MRLTLVSYHAAMIRPAMLAGAASIAIATAVSAAAIIAVTRDESGGDEPRVSCAAEDARDGGACPTATLPRRASSSSAAEPTLTMTPVPTSVPGARPLARVAGSPSGDTPPTGDSRTGSAPPADGAPPGAPAPASGSGNGGGDSSGGSGPSTAPTARPTSAPVPATPVSTIAVPAPTPTSGAGAQAPPPNDGDFCNDEVPLGGIAPQRPEWCFMPQAPAVTTFASGGNSWTDDWQHGASHARLGNVGDGYVAGGVSGGCATLHFRHNQHWMVDIAGDSGEYPALCGAWLRPERTFSLQGGRLVVEMEVAAPIAGTRGTDALSDSWPELVISTASRSTTAAQNSWGSALRKNGTYLYEAFPRAWTFGCRMQQSRHPICALYNDGEGHAGGPDRQWEVNQNGGEVRFQQGGDPSVGDIAASWKSCNSADDPDTVCRNKFRFEFYKDETGNHVLDIYSNGTLYYRAGLVDAQLDNIFNRPFYVYFGEFAYRIEAGTVVRFHWDHIAVNP